MATCSAVDIAATSRAQYQRGDPATEGGVRPKGALPTTISVEVKRTDNEALAAYLTRGSKRKGKKAKKDAFGRMKLNRFQKAPLES